MSKTLASKSVPVVKVEGLLVVDEIWRESCGVSASRVGRGRQGIDDVSGVVKRVASAFRHHVAGAHEFPSHIAELLDTTFHHSVLPFARVTWAREFLGTSHFFAQCSHIVVDEFRTLITV